MPGPADDIKNAVRDLGMSSPMMQIGSAMDRAGAAIERGVGRAKQLVRGFAEKTPQGTTRVAAPKERPEPVKNRKRVTIDRSSNGGYIVKHHYRPAYGGTPKPDTHTFASAEEAADHLHQTFGDKE